MWLIVYGKLISIAMRLSRKKRNARETECLTRAEMEIEE